MATTTTLREQKRNSKGAAVSQGRIQAKTWWALVRHPKALPCLFQSYEAAKENRDEDEYIVQVQVSAANPHYALRKWSRAKR